MSPRELADALEPLEYHLRRPAMGSLPGHHRGALRGSSGRLSGFTPLLHRMDPKNIDMVATRRALSPVPLVRVFRARVAITVAVLADLSASMGFSGQSWKLGELARMVSCVAYAAYRLGDRFCLVGFSDDVDLYLPPRRSAEYPLQAAEAVANHRAGRRREQGLLRACGLLPRRRCLVLLASDFHFEPPWLDRALAALQAHEVVLVALWDPAEFRSLPRRGWTVLFDPETGERRPLWLSARLARRIEQAFEARRRWLASRARAFGADVLWVEGRLKGADVARFFLTRREARA